MRIVFVAVAILCLALVPCVLCRSLTSTDSSLVDTRFNEDEALLHVHEVNRGSSEPGRSLVERRSLKKSGRKSGSKKKKHKAFRWHGQPQSLWVSVISVSIVVTILLLLWAYIVVTEKKGKDPNWHVRTFFRRKLKHQYTIKGMQARRKKSGKLDSNLLHEQDAKPEEPDVEKKVAAADAATDHVKTPVA